MKKPNKKRVLITTSANDSFGEEMNQLMDISPIKSHSEIHNLNDSLKESSYSASACKSTSTIFIFCFQIIINFETDITFHYCNEDITHKGRLRPINISGYRYLHQIRAAKFSPLEQFIVHNKLLNDNFELDNLESNDIVFIVYVKDLKMVISCIDQFILIFVCNLITYRVFLFLHFKLMKIIHTVMKMILIGL